MKTWSLEQALVTVYAGAAVAAQGIWAALTRRVGHDYERPIGEKFCERGACFYELDGAGPLAEQEVVEPVRLNDGYTPSWLFQQGSTGGVTLCDCGHWPHFGNVCAACGCSAVAIVSPAVSAGSGDRPAEVSSPRSEPSAGHPRPTSELLHDGATAIQWWLSGRPAQPGTRGHWMSAAHELRDRAAQFEAIED